MGFVKVVRRLLEGRILRRRAAACWNSDAPGLPGQCWAVFRAALAVRTSLGMALSFLVPALVCEHLLVLVVIVGVSGIFFLGRNESDDQKNEDWVAGSQSRRALAEGTRERTKQRPKPRRAYVHCAGGNSW